MSNRAKCNNRVSYAKNGMKAKTYETRVFEMEYSSLKRRILTVSGRVIPGKVRALTNMSQSAQTSSSLLCNQLKILFQIFSLSNPAIDVMQSTENWLA